MSVLWSRRCLGNRQQALRPLFTSNRRRPAHWWNQASEGEQGGLSHTAKVLSSVSKCARLKQRLHVVTCSFIHSAEAETNLSLGPAWSTQSSKPAQSHTVRSCLNQTVYPVFLPHCAQTSQNRQNQLQLACSEPSPCLPPRWALGETFTLCAGGKVIGIYPGEALLLSHSLHWIRM